MSDATDVLQLSNDVRIHEIGKRIDVMQKSYLLWSRQAKEWYRWLNFATIAFSAAVPVVVVVAPLAGAAPSAPWVSALAGLFGALATLSKSIDSLWKNHDTWLRNDLAYGAITSERFLFNERAGPYRNIASVDERIALYAERVDSAISAEANQWTGAEKAPQGGA